MQTLTLVDTGYRTKVSAAGWTALVYRTNITSFDSPTFSLSYMQKAWRVWHSHFYSHQVYAEMSMGVHLHQQRRKDCFCYLNFKDHKPFAHHKSKNKWERSYLGLILNLEHWIGIEKVSALKKTADVDSTSIRPILIKRNHPKLLQLF